MNKLFRHKFFLTGFFLGIVSFGVATISFDGGLSGDHPPSTEIAYGFPFKCCSLIYQKYMASVRADTPDKILISYPYLLLDLMIGLFFSFGLGAVFKFVIYGEE